LAGNIPFAAERYETEKKINNEELATLIAGDLWKKEGKTTKEVKAEKKE
jgi:hypothetical protein